MLGKFVSLGQPGSNPDNRMFIFEIEGLRQNSEMDSNSYPMRQSSKVIAQVPYSRMNAEMRRYNRLGGKIVNIIPLSEYSQQGEATDE